MRTHARLAVWMVLVALLALGLTGCFKSVADDIEPTPQSVVPVQNQTTPGPVVTAQPTDVLPPTTDPIAAATNAAGAPTAESLTPLPGGAVTLTSFPTLDPSTSTPLPTSTPIGAPVGPATLTPVNTAAPTQLTSTPLPTQGPPPTQAIQPTYTPLPTNTPWPSSTPPPTYTSQPTYTPQPSNTPIATVPQQLGPTQTFTPVPFVTFAPSPTYTLPPVSGLAQPAQPIAQPGQGGGPTEGQPLAERPTDDPNAAYGTGGPNPPPGQAVAQAPPSLTPNVAGAPTGGGTPPQVFVTPTPTPMAVAQGPTLPPAAITATAITFNATATAAALLGAPIPTWTPMGAQPGYPTQQPYVQPGQYPPNATVITATPYGQGGICAQHEVQLGETLYSIARRYDVTAQQIQAQNAGTILNIDQISAGDVLLIPCVVPATTTPVVVPVVTADPYSSGQGGQPVTTPTGTVMHTVQPGENLFSIARLYNVDVYELMRVNGYSAQAVIMIYEGEQLIIPNQPVVLTPTPIGYIGAPTPYIVIVTPYGQ